MSISREELIDILTVVSFLVHAEREIHVSEKKVLIATFKANSYPSAPKPEMTPKAISDKKDFCLKSSRL